MRARGPIGHGGTLACLLACLLAYLLAGTAADSELHPDFRKRLPGGTTLHRDAGGEVRRQTAEHAGSRGATSPAFGQHYLPRRELTYLAHR